MQNRFDRLAQTLPVDESAEKFLIGSALRSQGRLREAVIRIRPEHFHLRSHQIIWRTLCEFYDLSGEASWDHVAAHFTTGVGAPLRENIGGFGYLVDLYTEGLDASVDRHIFSILDTYARRALIFKCDEIMQRLVNRSEDIAELAGAIEEQARLSATISKESSGFKNFEDMIRECGGIEAFLSRGKVDSISYPWPSLTRITKGGMKPGQLLVVAGQSGKGKTALVLNILMRAMYSGKGIPLLFSLEMPKEEIGERILAFTSGVDTYRFADLTPEERDRIRNARQILSEHEYLVDDEDAATMAAIKSKTKSILGRRPVSLVVVDTIQLVEGRKGAKENREQEVARISRDMKRMAMQLRVPVLAVSQLNDVEDGKEPSIKNIRDSRTIWHNANALMFLHFTRNYDVRAGVHTGELDLILAKQRGGPEGRVKLTFHAPTGAFYEPEGENPYAD